MAIEFLTIYVRYFARYILANRTVKHIKTDLKGPFWATSREVNRSDFVAAAERFKKVYSDTFETLKKIHPKFWSKYKFDTI